MTKIAWNKRRVQVLMDGVLIRPGDRRRREVDARNTPTTSRKIETNIPPSAPEFQQRTLKGPNRTEHFFQDFDRFFVAIRVRPANMARPRNRHIPLFKKLLLTLHTRLSL